MTTPNGSPAWTRTATAATYGGHTDKSNYQQQSVCNPRTDVDAGEYIRAAEDLATAVRVSPFAILSLTCNDSGTPAAPTVSFVVQSNGQTTSSYSGDTPPSGFPTCTRNGDGDVTIQWDTLLSDAYGEEAAPNIKAVFPNRIATHTLDDYRTISVVARDTSGNPVADATIGVMVF